MDAYSKGGIEPPLREVIREPIVRTLMTRDGVRESDLIGLLAAAKLNLEAAGDASCGAAARRCDRRPMKVTDVVTRTTRLWRA